MVPSTWRAEYAPIHIVYCSVVCELPRPPEHRTSTTVTGVATMTTKLFRREQISTTRPKNLAAMHFYPMLASYLIILPHLISWKSEAFTSSNQFCHSCGTSPRQLVLSSLSSKSYVGMLANRKSRDYYDDDWDESPKSMPNKRDSTRFVGESDAARELKNMKYEPTEYLDDDEDDDYQNMMVRKDDLQKRRASPSQRYADDKYDDEDYDEDYEDEDGYEYYDEDEDDGREASATGNFWSNPKSGLDPLPKNSGKSNRMPPSSTASPRRRKSRRKSSGSPKSRTTFRSGTPAPPGGVRNFYDRLFWYGFEDYDTTSNSDKTMFGGTKGKFNGLELLQGGSSRPVADDSQSRGRSSSNPRRQRDDYDDYYDDDDDDEEDYEDDIEDDYYLRGKEDDVDYDDDRDLSIRRRPLPPPSQEDDDRIPSRRRRSSRSAQGRSRRDRQRTQEDDWISSEVSGWFEPDEDRNERRFRRKKKEESSPLSFVAEKMFGGDDDDRNFKAEMYEQQLGKRKKKNRRSTRPSSYGYDDDDSPRRRRPGYAYRYVDDDPSSPVVDIENSNAELPDTQSTTSFENDATSPTVVDVTVEDGKGTGNSDSATKDEAASSGQSRKMTWTERAQAVERVPPSGIAAWGPSGDVGMDARTKATLDALEEIREAKQKLELREEKVIVAQEDMIVVRADAELQKKRLLARNRAREVRGMLRRIEEDVDFASMGLRRAKAQAAAARDQLNDLEAQHWALLSLYDADKAFNEVIQTIEEVDNTDFGRPKVDDNADSSTIFADVDTEFTTDEQTNDANADTDDAGKTDAA